ncbi:HEPN domain-containing protein [Sphingobacterium detergens]|uniref:Uncharacterized protein n=1 Tax=Sphingobacterium detergens TaxID=1145106 RepID=A0A420BGT5_SPHD1|nr:HEPN domain-containing protein [Sphingobacterium detergens]RKE55908.1 hypothetical protein DFQ12_0748 [Sphingobacterium detergens]
MFNKVKYQGELWFPDFPDQRCFCILSIVDNKIELETNLVSPDRYSQKNVYPLIFGIFNGLGCLTFVDCKLGSDSTGMIRSAIYIPKYCFNHIEHIVNPKNLQINRFRVAGIGLGKWINLKFEFDKSLLKTNNEVTHNFDIQELGLQIKLNSWITSSVSHEQISLKKSGNIEFSFFSPINVKELLDYYTKAKKLIQFLNGKSGKFSFFNFKCSQHEDWSAIYFKELIFKDSTFEYLSIDFDKISDHLPLLFTKMFTDEKFYFCVNRLLDNQVEGQLTHSKRFTNSISTFEGYCKLNIETKNLKLRNFLKKNQHDILTLSGINEEYFDEFCSKIISSRDYYVHANIKNNNIFSDFELLYISFLLDILVAFNLLKQIEVPQDILKMIIYRARETYNGMQSFNRELSKDTFFDH